MNTRSLYAAVCVVTALLSLAPFLGALSPMGSVSAQCVGFGGREEHAYEHTDTAPDRENETRETSESRSTCSGANINTLCVGNETETERREHTAHADGTTSTTTTYDYQCDSYLD